MTVGADPGPLLERRRGHDRARSSARRNSANGSKNSASASRPGSSSPTRNTGSCRSSTNTRARRWATCRWARAPAVTPMQMVQGYTAIAHDGIERPPQLIKRIGEDTGPRAEGPPRDQRQDRRARSAKCSRACSGRKAPPPRSASPATRLAGKTGTAQVAENGGYSKTKYIASFIGFAPAKHPKFLAAVIVDQPEGEIYGGSVAAPAFGEIADILAAVPRRAAGIARSRGPPGALPRIGRDETGGTRLGSLVRGAGADRRRRRRSRSPTLAYDSRGKRGPGRCSSAWSGRSATGTSSRRRWSRRGRRRWWSSGSSRSRCRRSWCRARGRRWRRSRRRSGATRRRS